MTTTTTCDGCGMRSPSLGRLSGPRGWHYVEITLGAQVADGRDLETAEPCLVLQCHEERRARRYDLCFDCAVNSAIDVRLKEEIANSGKFLIERRMKWDKEAPDDE